MAEDKKARGMAAAALGGIGQLSSSIADLQQELNGVNDLVGDGIPANAPAPDSNEGGESA